MKSIEKINRILAARGMTGAELTRRLGLSNSAYSTWNKGRNDISKPNLYRIAQVLDVPVEDIYPDTEDKTVENLSGDDDMTETLEYIRNNPGMRILFSKAKHATPEQLLAIAQMIDTFRGDK